jgi:hypothetical protein
MEMDIKVFMDELLAPTLPSEKKEAEGDKEKHKAKQGGPEPENKKT